jgi:hypothetical protein
VLERYEQLEWDILNSVWTTVYGYQCMVQTSESPSTYDSFIMFKVKSSTYMNGQVKTQGTYTKRSEESLPELRNRGLFFWQSMQDNGLITTEPVRDPQWITA